METNQKNLLTLPELSKKLESINCNDWWQSNFGGQSNESDCYIALLLLMNDIDSLIMKDEIFGPLLPILEYSSDADIYTIVSRYENHCLYTFYGK
jgi:acyl-CoA reductase-like NAD-dependent aldehyde dehydrogenase